MKLTQTLSVVYCMIRLVWMDFSITLPETVEAVSGHCVLIPCQFKIGSVYTHLLKNTSVGKWFKEDNIVFDSSTPDNNQNKGKITGDLSEKNCTTIFTSISPDTSGKYYFRIEGEEGLKWSYKKSHVSISVSDSPPKPTLSLNVNQKEVKDLENVMEGISVNLICSALAPCPSNPPNLTWTNVPSIISVQEIQNTTFISSHLSFTASHLHDGDQITCSASYQLEDKSIKSVSSSRLLRVLYPPRDTSVSVVPPGPVLLGSSVSLICSSDGNPAVLNFTWYRENGEQIGTGDTLNITETNDTHSGLYYCRAQNPHGTHNSSVQLDVHFSPRASLSSHCNSSDGGILCVCEAHGFPVPKLEWRLSGGSVSPSVNRSIREDSVGSTGLRSIITIDSVATDTPTLQCLGSNNLGSTNQQFSFISCSSPGFFHMSSVLFGAAVGASAVMLLCIIYVCGRRKHHKPSQEENAGLVLNDRAVYQDEEEESLYTNKSSKRVPNPRDPDILHYSTISFPGEDGSGEIRGLSSLTSEYSTVKHSHGERGEEEITVTEMEPPSAEEVIYGNIVRHSHSDVDADVKLEQPETRKTEPERSTHSAEEEGLYAEVKHKEHKEKA